MNASYTPTEWVELLMNANDPLAFVKVTDAIEGAFGPAHASAGPDLMAILRQRGQTALSDLGGSASP